MEPFKVGTPVLNTEFNVIATVAGYEEVNGIPCIKLDNGDSFKLDGLTDRMVEISQEQKIMYIAMRASLGSLINGITIQCSKLGIDFERTIQMIQTVLTDALRRLAK